jgi:hypothetical protein
MRTSQAAYREFLNSDFWKGISTQCKERDGNCVRCGSVKWLQAHHVQYPDDWYQTKLEDLETLCRECHRVEHGYGPNEFANKWYEIRGHIWHQKRPPTALWVEFKSMMYFDFDTEEFADLMYEYVICTLAFEREAHVENWWMDKEKDKRWRDKAKRVKELILSRHNRGTSSN